MNHQPAVLIIIQKPGEADGGSGKIVIPYGTDLTNLAYRLSALGSGFGSGSGSGEGVSPKYIIDEIIATNRYVGVDQCYNLFETHQPFSILYEMNNKFFQYFTKLDADDKMEAFGVLIQIYDKYFTGNLLKIDKQGNRIEFGSESHTSEGNKNLYETETVLQGYTEVSNYTGFKITNKNENSYTVIVPHEKDVSFMDYFGQPSIYKDIVISKALRFNDQTDNLVIQKPGEDYGGGGKIVIFNIKSRLRNLEIGRNYEYVINKIKTINLYLGINKYYYNKNPLQIKNEKVFQYYKKTYAFNDLIIS
jgi:hypothetical protein